MVNPSLRSREKEVYRNVYQTITPMRDSIRPDEVTEPAGSWEEVRDEDLDNEIHEAVKVDMSEGDRSNMVKGLAIRYWLEDMPRVRMQHLVFDNHEEALEKGYWPYNVSRMGAEAMIYDLNHQGEVDIPNTARNRAHSLVKSAIADKLDPRVDEPEY